MTAAPDPMAWLAVATVAAVAATLVTGCGGAGTERSQAPETSMRSSAAGLPACSPPPSGSAPAEVTGLVLPPGSVVTRVRPQGPVVNVEGYVALTPVQVRAFYQRRKDLQIFQIEDEVFEAEAFFGTAGHRNFVRARAVCRDGSRIDAVVAGDLDASAVPRPSGSARQ